MTRGGLIRLLSVHAVRRLVRDRARSVLLFLAVGLGVAVLIAVLHASEASVRSFRDSLSSLGGEDSAEVRARGGSFLAGDAAPLYRALQHDFETVGFWEGDGAAPSGRVRLIAVDPLEFGARSSEFSAAAGEDGAAFAWVTGDFLRARGLEAGGRITVSARGASAEFGLREITGEAAVGLGRDAAVVTLSGAAPFRRTDEFTGIRLTPREGRGAESLAHLAPTLAQWRAPAFYLGTVRQKAAQAERLFAAFRLNIGVLVLMTLVVCGFTVFGAAQISVLMLQRELAVMRTLGFSRRGIAGVILGEAALIGLAGAVCGATLGRPVTEVCARLFLKSVSVLYAGGAEPSEVWGGDPVVIYGAALVAGVVVCLLGSVVPAWRAAKIPPGLVARGPALAAPARSRRALGLAIGAAGAAAACCVGSYYWASAPLAHGASFWLVGALILCAFPLLRGLTLLARPILGARFGAAGLFAFSNLTAGGRLLSVAVAANTVGIALLVGLGVMVGSFRSTLEEWVGYTIRADVFVRPVDIGSLDRPARLPRSFGSVLEGIPGIRGVGRFAAFEFDTGKGSLTVGGADFLDHPGARVYRILAGELSRERLAHRDEVVVSEAAARKLGVAPGGTVEIAGHRVIVGGIFKDFSTEHGIVLFDFDRFERLFGASGWSSASLYLADRGTIEEVIEALKRSDVGAELFVQRNAELRDSIFSIFDQTFQITELMRFIVVGVCALGFVLTLLQLQWERRADIKTLTTLGIGRGGLRAATCLEGGVMIAPSVLGGVVGGGALALILVYLVNPLSFGWTLNFMVEPGAVVGPLGVVVLSNIIGAIVAAGAPVRAPAKEDGDEEEG